MVFVAVVICVLFSAAKVTFSGELGSFVFKKIEKIVHVYDTVSEAVNGLKKRGFSLDFNLGENCLICHDDKFDIKDFEIVEMYRFEGNSDPADEAIVYAIASIDGRKGVLVSGYGISAEGMSAEMAIKLNVKNN